MADEENGEVRFLVIDKDKNFQEQLKAEHGKQAKEKTKAMLPTPFFSETARTAQSFLSDREVNYAGVFINPAVGTPAWFAIVKNCHQYRSGIPLFIIYDEKPKISKEEAEKLGVWGFVKKPMTYDKLLELAVEDDQSDDGMENLKPDPQPSPAPSQELKDADFTDVNLKNLVGRTKSLFDLYVKLSSGKYVKILSAGDILSADRVESYKAKGVDKLLILKTAQQDYLKFYDEMTANMLKDTSVSIETKTELVTDQGAKTISFLKSAGFNDLSMQAAQQYVQNTAEMVNQIAAAQGQVKKLLSDMASYEHSVACTTLSSLFMKRLGAQTPSTVQAIGLTCFLHDVALVDQEQVIKDEDITKMNDAQKAIFLSHPEEGAKLVKKMKSVPPIVVQAVAQHHLRKGKKGFPADKVVDEVNRISELIGICEDFLLLMKAAEKDPKINPITELQKTAKHDFSEVIADAFIKTVMEKS